MRSISVVIPNYNGRHLLQQNLPFLLAALKAGNCQYEIIIPDDASTDDSVQFIAQNYPDITLVKSDTNSGFSKNINKGIAIAKMQLVLLLNSDIKLGEQYFAQQLKYFERPDTFGVMGLILDDVTGAVAEACKYPLESVFKINYFRDIDIKSTGADVYTYYLSGANALIDRAKLQELGGFNELFSPFYHEDLDLSLRAWESGWKCYYESEAVCRHAVSSTIKAHSTRQYIKTISTRNKFILHYFHLQGFRLYLWAMVTFLSLLVRWALRQGFYYKAFSLFIKQFPDIRASKQQFKKLATEKQRYICFDTVKKNIRESITRVLQQNK